MSWGTYCYKSLPLVQVPVWGCTAARRSRSSSTSLHLFAQPLPSVAMLLLGAPLPSPRRRQQEEHSTIIRWILSKHVTDPFPSPPHHLALDVFCLCHLHFCLVWDTVVLSIFVVNQFSSLSLLSWSTNFHVFWSTVSTNILYWQDHLLTTNLRIVETVIFTLFKKIDTLENQWNHSMLLPSGHKNLSKALGLKGVCPLFLRMVSYKVSHQYNNADRTRF